MRGLSHRHVCLRFLLIFGATLWALPSLAFDFSSPASGVVVTLLHTNDVHAHFRSDKSALALGGLARLKTAIDRERALNPDALLVDGGDWAEGSVYYTEGGGRASLELMDSLGYDVAVVGNHDWLNGPDVLLDAIANSKSRVALVGANFVLSGYSRATEFAQWIPPYVIREAGGIKIAFIGLANFDPIYTRYVSPVDTFDPRNGGMLAELARSLKTRVDIVVGVSHNPLDDNRGFLKSAPDLDLIIGAHDHAKLTHPIEVARPGASPGWIVEAGSWGQFLGKIELRVAQNFVEAGSRVKLIGYQLTQIDRTLPEDESVLRQIAKYEQAIENRMGPMFAQKVADCEVDLERVGPDSAMGDLVTDAYRSATGADVAVDYNQFIYGELHPGPVMLSDLFNAYPAVYDLGKGKSWTIETMKMKGALLSWLLDVVFTWKKLADFGSFNLSGLSVSLDPAKQRDLGAGDFEPVNGGLGLLRESAIKSVTAAGREIYPDRIYKVAVGQGVMQGLGILHAMFPGTFAMDELQDTGVESWRALAQYFGARSPLRAQNLGLHDRVRMAGPDLGFYADDIQWNASGQVTVRVSNLGTVSSQAAGVRVRLMANKYGADFSKDSEYRDLAPPQDLGALAPGQSQFVRWAGVSVPKDRGVRILTAGLSGARGELNTSNDQATSFR